MSGQYAPIPDPHTQTHAPTRWPFLATSLTLTTATLATGAWVIKTAVTEGTGSSLWWKIGCLAFEFFGASISFAAWKVLSPVQIPVQNTSLHTYEEAFVSTKVEMVALRPQVFQEALAHLLQELQTVQHNVGSSASAARIELQDFEGFEAYQDWGSILEIVAQLKQVKTTLPDVRPRDQSPLLQETLTAAHKTLKEQNDIAVKGLTLTAFFPAFEKKELGSEELNRLWHQLGYEIARARMIAQKRAEQPLVKLRQEHGEFSSRLENISAEPAYQELLRQKEDLDRKVQDAEKNLQNGTQEHSQQLQEIKDQAGRELEDVKQRLRQAEEKLEQFSNLLGDVNEALAPFCVALAELLQRELEQEKVTFSTSIKGFETPLKTLVETVGKLKWGIEMAKKVSATQISFDDLQSKYLTPIYKELFRVAEAAKVSLKDDTTFFSDPLKAPPQESTREIWGKLSIEIARVEQFLNNAAIKMSDSFSDFSSSDVTPETTPQKATYKLKAVLKDKTTSPLNLGTSKSDDDEE